MTFGSLFSGIGGIDLGLERAGMKCAWQVENDPYAVRVLEKHWPQVARHAQVESFPPEPLSRWQCDLIAGGFPCQPVSTAGKKLGETDERWLWPEFVRIIRLLRQGLLLLENVPGLLVRGFDQVLRDLAQVGMDAEWGVLSACAFGSPHSRERVFLVAYPHGKYGQEGLRVFSHRKAQGEPRYIETNSRCWLEPYPRFPGVVDGIPHRVDRLRTLGNAVVPQVAQWIGERIMQAMDGEKDEE